MEAPGRDRASARGEQLDGWTLATITPRRVRFIRGAGAGAVDLALDLAAGAPLAQQRPAAPQPNAPSGGVTPTPAKVDL